MFDTTIDATTKPTSTNFVRVGTYFSQYINGKLGVSSNISSEPMLSQCQLYIGHVLKLFGAFNELKDDYVSPEQFVASPDFLVKIEQYNFLVEDIRNNLTSEDEPAYWINMYGHYGRGGGAGLF